MSLKKQFMLRVRIGVRVMVTEEVWLGLELELGLGRAYTDV